MSNQLKCALKNWWSAFWEAIATEVLMGAAIAVAVLPLVALGLRLSLMFALPGLVVLALVAVLIARVIEQRRWRRRLARLSETLKNPADLSLEKEYATILSEGAVKDGRRLRFAVPVLTVGFVCYAFSMLLAGSLQNFLRWTSLSLIAIGAAAWILRIAIRTTADAQERYLRLLEIETAKLRGEGPPANENPEGEW